MKKVWGVDFIEGMIKIALGISFEKIQQTKPLKYMRSEVLRIDHPGILTELRFDDELREKKYFEKTGYNHPFQNPDVKEKIKNTYMSKTGFNFAFYYSRF